ncbi:FIG00561498: hypothetical protein [hydrothermal vent metagenome]|uniref:TIGR03790 family protein n=1 Tax=hydrothermal vent metagenome TaxID=652676 RepID=A0A3B0YFG8_9ZZZZ
MVQALLLLITLCSTAVVAMPKSAPPGLHISLPKSHLSPNELALIVNDADPLSVQIANYYQQARQLPDENIIHIRLPHKRGRLSPTEFAPLKATVDRATPEHIQAYALTWATPFRVDCMSITSAFSFGYDKAWCSAKRCAPTRPSPLFRYRGSRPWADRSVRPSMSIAAKNFAEAKLLIDRGIAADGTQPMGTAYLMSTPDKARNVRARHFQRIQQAMQGWIRTRQATGKGIKNRDDILFYFTGAIKVPYLDTLEFGPGAVADHLTSAGGNLTGKQQMSALRWLEAGATGSYGTVVEPCNLLGKFPNPGLLMDAYGSGSSLIEAYWQSVQQPGEGIFIGEPLAAPFAGYTVKVELKQLRLHTRSLQPGRYRLSYSAYPIGPFIIMPDFLNVGYHQINIPLPDLGPGYYRLRRAGTI